MDDLEGDFNRINPAYDGRRVRYLYMSAFTQHDRHLGDFDAVVRYDDRTGERTLWSAGPTGHVGESVFAADPDGTAEDDGWLLNAVYHDDRDAHRPGGPGRTRRRRRAGRHRPPPVPDAVRLPRQLVPGRSVTGRFGAHPRVGSERGVPDPEHRSGHRVTGGTWRGIRRACAAVGPRDRA